MGSGDGEYFVRTHNEAKCRKCKEYLKPEGITYPTYVVVHPYHFDGWHVSCLPRLVTAEDRLERIEKEYGVSITLGEDDG